MRAGGLRVEVSIRDAISTLADEARRSGMRVEIIDPPLDPGEQHAAWVEVYRTAEASGSNWEAVATVARRQRRARQAWDAALRHYDAIMLQPAMCAAFTHRPTGSAIKVDGIPVAYWGLARYTEPLNLTGHPAIVFPIGHDATGLPIGVQVVAGHGRDHSLIRLAAWLGSLSAQPAMPDL